MLLFAAPTFSVRANIAIVKPLQAQGSERMRHDSMADFDGESLARRPQVMHEVGYQPRISCAVVIVWNLIQHGMIPTASLLAYSSSKL